jgi:hypothetical protein
LRGELTVPAEPAAALVLAHGAGAGFRHTNLLAIASALSHRSIASLRFNFPFMEAGKRRVDDRATALAALTAAGAALADRLPSLPLYLGGHSFGGRMASHALAAGAIAAGATAGLVLLSFPLHPAGRPGVARAGHLADITVPMLFVSGTRDALAEPELLRGVVRALHDAELRWLDDADHGYRVRRRGRRDPRPVFDELGDYVAAFVARTTSPDSG